jgi:hypothetical protein
MISKAAWISRSKNQIGLTTVPTIPATNETVKDVLGPTVKDVVGLNSHRPPLQREHYPERVQQVENRAKGDSLREHH